MRRDLPPAVVHLVTAGQMDQFLRVERLLLRRHHEIIDQDVIHEGASHRARIAEIVHLNRRGPQRENLRAGVLRVAFQIDQDVNFIRCNPRRGFRKRDGLHVRETVERTDQSPPHRALVVGTIGIAEHRESIAIVFLDQFGDQPGGRMGMEVRGQISDGRLRPAIRCPLARRAAPWTAYRIQVAVRPLPRTAELLFGRGHCRQDKENERRQRKGHSAVGIAIDDLDQALGKDLQVFPAALMLKGMDQRAERSPRGPVSVPVPVANRRPLRPACPGPTTHCPGRCAPRHSSD